MIAVIQYGMAVHGCILSLIHLFKQALILALFRMYFSCMNWTCKEGNGSTPTRYPFPADIAPGFPYIWYLWASSTVNSQGVIHVFSGTSAENTWKMYRCLWCNQCGSMTSGTVSFPHHMLATCGRLLNFSTSRLLSSASTYFRTIKLNAAFPSNP